eukprot:CAMPEP_0185207914 /NCGR_PEP_ID=MMETSP1140-20130426/61121_1 /TAXON_ID=298111 /ORGANISM="Pavlova sp., Strain CCMP459" /LENGTH=68 /DNA_ID=CAMNT_0027775617 /DNA_START=451 /DNA_END=657 /DNA_ORIENTATION=+
MTKVCVERFPARPLDWFFDHLHTGNVAMLHSIPSGHDQLSTCIAVEAVQPAADCADEGVVLRAHKLFQ